MGGRESLQTLHRYSEWSVDGRRGGSNVWIRPEVDMQCCLCNAEESDASDVIPASSVSLTDSLSHSLSHSPTGPSAIGQGVRAAPSPDRRYDVWHGISRQTPPSCFLPSAHTVTADTWTGHIQTSPACTCSPSYPPSSLPFHAYQTARADRKVDSTYDGPFPDGFDEALQPPLLSLPPARQTTALGNWSCP